MTTNTDATIYNVVQAQDGSVRAPALLARRPLVRQTGGKG